ncbi:hypothetical protein [Azospirillum himalayense]|uniref:Uncharacterized protein n=1 Tax=Azospirillum himalayense TaxID=654847 RepID=A0ABW0G0Y7_9PROT
MRALAAEVGVSDVALAKACRKADIPVPERGYWARKQAGKPTSKRPLPPRFPGASDTIEIGGGSYRGYYRSEIGLDTPLPPPPTFEEDMAALTERVRRMVGKVTCPKLTTSPHRLIATLLEKDEVRRQEYARTRFSMYAPRYDTPNAKRRLRILNGIFLAAARAGCNASIDTTKWPRNPNDAGIHVGDQHITFTLEPVPTKGKPASAVRQQEHLRLSIHSRSHNGTAHKSWQDSDEASLEDLVCTIVVEIIVAAETFHRQNAVCHHEWLVKRKAELVEAEHQRKIEQIRKEREQQEKEERERIERLVGQAMSLHQAETIRTYVQAVLTRAAEMPVTPENLDRWATWAMMEADRIDPVKNGSAVGGILSVIGAPPLVPK